MAIYFISLINYTRKADNLKLGSNCDKFWLFSVLLVLSATQIRCDDADTIPIYDEANEQGIEETFSRSFEHKVTLYEFAYGEGAQITLPTNQCHNVPHWLNNNIASVDTHHHCVRLYDDEKCNGEAVQIQPDDPDASNLHFWHFIDKTSSIGPCLEFQQVGLQYHNILRAKHGSPPLYLNETLNIRAQQEAESLVRQSELPPLNSFISGELLYVTTLSSQPSMTMNNNLIINQIIADAINFWFKQKLAYDPRNPEATAFTQLIWKSSTQLGIGLASYGRRTIVLAKYRPVGNIDGYFHENVST